MPAAIYYFDLSPAELDERMKTNPDIARALEKLGWLAPAAAQTLQDNCAELRAEQLKTEAAKQQLDAVFNNLVQYASRTLPPVYILHSANDTLDKALGRAKDEIKVLHAKNAVLLQERADALKEVADLKNLLSRINKNLNEQDSLTQEVERVANPPNVFVTSGRQMGKTTLAQSAAQNGAAAMRYAVGAMAQGGIRKNIVNLEEQPIDLCKR